MCLRWLRLLGESGRFTPRLWREFWQGLPRRARRLHRNRTAIDRRPYDEKIGFSGRVADDGSDFDSGGDIFSEGLVEGVEELYCFVVAGVVLVMDFLFGAFEGFFGGNAV